MKFKGKEHLIKEYKGYDICKKEEIQNYAWDLRQKYLGEKHQSFILTMSGNVDKAGIKKLIEKFGGMNRLWLLVPHSTESPFLPEKGKF